MDTGDYRRIFDFFFSGVEVPENLKQQFYGWLDIHGDEPETKELLEEYWNAASSASPEFDITEGLERLMEQVGRKDGIGKGGVHPKQTVEKKQLRNWFSRLLGSRALKYSVSVAAAAAIFFAGAETSEIVGGHKKETVLMASSENIGSYILPDGSKVWLNKNSWLTYNQKYGKRRRKVELKGEGYFEVNRDESRPFIVEMQNNLEVKVLGTTFNACSYPSLNKAEVILRSGSVLVSDKTAEESVILKPDQKYTWNDGEAEVSAVNAMNCCRWFESRLVFDNVKLRDILENLSHKYQLAIRHDVGSLAEKRMSMTIRDESMEDFLDILTSLLPVKWRHQGSEIIIENKTKKR